MLFSISFCYHYNQMLKLLLLKLFKRLKLFDSYQNDKNKYLISHQYFQKSCRPGDEQYIQVTYLVKQRKYSLNFSLV